jgi:hypothetical protein
MSAVACQPDKGVIFPLAERRNGLSILALANMTFQTYRGWKLVQKGHQQQLPSALPETELTKPAFGMSAIEFLELL